VGGVVRYLRLVGWATATGWIVGLVVFGVGGRIVMRILALTSDQAVQGAFTDAGEEIGVISFEGTLALLVFGGLGAGTLGGFVYAGVRPVLPERTAPRLACCGVLGAVVGAFLLVNPDSVDFAILDPLWLAVALCVALGALGGVAFCAVGDRLRPFYEGVRARGWRLVAFAPMVILLIPFFAVVALLGGAVWALSQRAPGSGRVRALARGVAVAGVAVLAVVSVGRIADVEGREPVTSDYVDPFAG
jgi:hypothetical protein